MQKEFSIFNDVLGPVMTGPSSSHTAGPWRIAYTAGFLLDDIISFEISFPQDSSYAGVYRGQRSDIGLIAGILKLPIDSPQFPSAYALAEERGLKVEFKITAPQGGHPNTATLKISSKEKSREVETISTGGGAFKIIAIDGQAVEISGESNYLFVTTKENREKIISTLRKNNIQSETTADNEYFFLEKVSQKITPELLATLRQLNKNIYFVPAVLPVVSFGEIKVPFATAAETLEYCAQNNISLAEAALLYEMERSGWTKDQVYDFAEFLLQTMERSIHRAMTEDLPKLGFLELASKKMYAKYLAEPERVADIGILQKASIYAIGIMEVNIAMGVVVAAPTAGSCGVIGAILFALSEGGQYSRREILNALLCAGLIGIFISNQATFAAELCGCQAEIGSASSMAAAAVAYLLGASPKESCQAASMAMQHMLGLICDPVAGSAEIPCINRNTCGVSNAVTSANMVICGFDPYIPLDETIQTMFKVGTMLPCELRCTGLGGLCLTKSAQNLAPQLVR